MLVCLEKSPPAYWLYEFFMSVMGPRRYQLPTVLTLHCLLMIWECLYICPQIVDIMVGLPAIRYGILSQPRFPPTP
jgi:hypothetical protein